METSKKDGINARKNLACMRKAWSNHSIHTPFSTSLVLPDMNMTVAEFAFMFVLGQHNRTSKKSQSNSSNVHLSDVDRSDEET